MLVELGKETRWATCEHEHGSVYVRGNDEGADPEPVRAIDNAIAFFDKHMRSPTGSALPDGSRRAQAETFPPRR